MQSENVSALIDLGVSADAAYKLAEVSADVAYKLAEVGFDPSLAFTITISVFVGVLAASLSHSFIMFLLAFPCKRNKSSHYGSQGENHEPDTRNSTKSTSS